MYKLLTVISGPTFSPLPVVVMKTRQCILSLLIFISGSVLADEQQYSDDQYPTAKIAVMDHGPDSSNSRYALQVSGDQLQEYLKALKHVPESVYSNGAHIIADMDESSLPDSMSGSRYDSESDGDGRESVDFRSLIPAIRLDQHHPIPEQDQVEPEERADAEFQPGSYVYEASEPIQRYERTAVPFFNRPSARELLRDLLMRREDVKVEPQGSAVSVIEDQMKEAKALQVAEATETLKEKVVEALKQKEAEHNERKQVDLSKEIPTASTPRIPEGEIMKYKPEEERAEKYRAQESENKFKKHEKYGKAEEGAIKQSSHRAAEASAPKEIASPELFMSRVQDELSKSLYNNHAAVHYDRENRTESIDMRTVRELLNTLIKQIEKIHSAARTLTAVTNAPEYESKRPRKEYKDHQKETYYAKHHKQEERDEREPERHRKHRKPLPYEIIDPYTPSEVPVHVSKKAKRVSKERTVYLKPHEVMKLLEPEPYESVELPVRRSRPHHRSSSSPSIRRMHTPFPSRRSMYPNFYPGTASDMSTC